MEAPERLADDVREIWEELAARLPSGRKVDATRFEVYCEQLHAFRVAAKDVRENGVRIEDATGRTIRNPSVDALRDMTVRLTDAGASRTRTWSAWSPRRPWAMPNSTRVPALRVVTPSGRASERT